MNTDGQRRSTATFAILIVFAATRLWILLFAPVRESTVGVLAQMAFEQRLAASRNESFYALHARLAEAGDELRARTGGPPADPARRSIEYPPLAIACIVVPTYFCDPVTSENFTDQQMRQYTTAFRCCMAAVDAITFAVLAWLVHRLYRDRTAPWRLAAYVLAGALLFPLLYDRPDLIVGTLLLIAAALLIAEVHWSISLAVLAVAVNFKLVPLLVTPVFVIASIPAAVRGVPRRFFSAVIIRAAAFLAMCGAIFLPFYLATGRAALDFLTYHAQRGVHVESVPATLLLLFSNVTGLEYTHGAIDIVSPAAHATGMIATSLSAIVVLIIALAMIVRARRARETACGDLVSFVVLTLTAAMVCSKVFSPQYLLWLVPIIPLLPRGIALHVLFMVTCALTTYIFPYHYWTDIARPVVEPPRYAILPPTGFGVALLAMRNVMLLAFVAALAASMRQRAQIEPPRGGG